MARLTGKETRKICDLLEEGLNFTRVLDRAGKMKLRRKIRNEVAVVATWPNPNLDMILSRLDWKLRDLFSVIPPRFRDNLTVMLQSMLKDVKNRKDDEKRQLRESQYKALQEETCLDQAETESSTVQASLPQTKTDPESKQHD